MNPDNNPQNPSQQPPGSSFSPGSVYGPPSGSGSQIPIPPEPHKYDDSNSNKTKKIMIILGGLVGIFILVAVIIVVAGGDNKSKQPAVEQSTGAQDLYKEPTAIEIENLNNSISDDVTNLSTDADFPSDKLADEKLGL